MQMPKKALATAASVVVIGSAVLVTAGVYTGFFWEGYGEPGTGKEVAPVLDAVDPASAAEGIAKEYNNIINMGG